MNGGIILDFITSVKALDLFIKFFKGDVKNLGTIEYVPQKPSFRVKKQKMPLSRSTAEGQGMHSRRLSEFLQKLSAQEEISPHNLMVLRHGQVILQGSWSPYSPEYPHMMYSLSKSVTATAVGIAIAEGYLSLDEHLVDIFSDKLPALLPLVTLRQRPITVRHLLTMSAGVGFNEVGSVLEKDWVRAYLESDTLFEPGSKFFYNSLNTFMLSAILAKKTGMDLMTYLTPRLFEPMGITDVYWEKSPTGIEKGGWGLYLLIEDMAKLGQLYLNRGKWMAHGKETQIVPENWVEEAIKSQIINKLDCPNGYGYHIWRCPMKESYQFNGVFGQYVIVMPKQDIVIALTCGSDSLFPQGAVMDLAAEYFEDAENYSNTPLGKDWLGEKMLLDTQKVLFYGKPVLNMPKPSLHTALLEFGDTLKAVLPEKQIFHPAPQDEKINGRKYKLESNICSLLPLILQGVYNNYAQGITTLSFSYGENGCTLFAVEGQITNKLKIGFKKPLYSKLTFRQDSFLVGTTGEWVKNEDDLDVLRLTVCFVETPDTRKIKLIFDRDNLQIKMDESPRVSKALRLIMKLFGGTRNNFEKQLDTAVTQQQLRASIRHMVTPMADGRDVTAPAIIDPWDGL